jgi:hypothetical protein
MTVPTPSPSETRSRGVVEWLNRPLSAPLRFVGWCCALVVFIGFTSLLGGPTEFDAALSVYSTWAIASGHMACSYVHVTRFHVPPIGDPFTLIAPLYPLLSALVLAVTRVVHFAGFPTSSQLGPHCSTAIVAMFRWSANSNAIQATVRLAYFSWIFVLGGAVALLRAIGRGRTNWEPLTLILLAILAPVTQCITEFFHPQDIVAIGFALGSVACMKRGRWEWTGALMALAFATNQFVLLLAVPMFILIPTAKRLRAVLAGLSTAAIILLPVIVLTSGRAFRFALIGSSVTKSLPLANPWFSHLQGALLIIVTRVPPIAIAALLAWWAKRRLGERVMDPVPLLSLLATCLALRLMFEVTLFAYYYAAAIVFLLLLEVASGRIRGAAITWYAVLIVAYNPMPLGFVNNPVEWALKAHEVMPTIFFVVVTTLIVVDALRRRVRWYLVAAAVLVGLTLVKWPWNHGALRHLEPLWFWQILLVPTLLWLTLSPLISAINERRHTGIEVAPEATVPADH